MAFRAPPYQPDDPMAYVTPPGSSTAHPSPNLALLQGFRASAAGVTRMRNPYPEADPRHVKWNMGWQICFYGEELPGVS